MSRLLITVFTTVLSLTFSAFSPLKKSKKEETKKAEHNSTHVNNKRTFYGVASYYADKFRGRTTADGSSYKHGLRTAACNVLPLGSWIRVTNLKNKKSIIVRINDRLHPKNKRIVDLSKVGAKELGYTHQGLAQVKVENLGKVRPS